MKLALQPVPALASREEVLFSRGKRRRGNMSGPEFSVVRVPQVPEPSAEHRAFAALREELGLDVRIAAGALRIKRDELLALERGELQPRDPGDWPKAMAALRDAATHRVPG